VGIGVGVAVRVGVNVGTGEAVDVGGATGVGREADWPAPHAERRMEIETTTKVLLNTRLIFLSSILYE
jgi:hypothetical protein